MQNIQSSLILVFRNCKRCCRSLFTIHKIQDNYHFYCNICQIYTSWTQGTILERSSIPFSTLEKLIFLFLNNKPPAEAFDILGYDFVGSKLNYNTIVKYYNILNYICLTFYYEDLSSKMLEGEIELDETHLYSEKKSHALARPYSLSSVWLVGMRKRGSKEFLIVEVERRDEETLLSIILKHIKRKSKIYTDPYSCYANNNSYPRNQNLYNTIIFTHM